MSRRSARTWDWRIRCREPDTLGARGIRLCLAAGAAPAGPADAGRHAGRTPAAAALPGLVSTDELARWQAAGPVVVLDVRTDVFAYLKGHLPGAEYLNSETLRASEGGIPTRLLSAGAYRELFSRLGVDFDRPVVIYSAGESRNIDATFLAWLLAGFGHPQVCVLDGGLLQVAAGAAAGGAAVPAHPRGAAFPTGRSTRRRPRWRRSRQRPGAGRAAGGRPPARPVRRHGGRADAPRAHPGRDQPLLAGRSDAGRVRPRLEAAAELRQAYAAQGITPDQDIIAYCNSATEASHVHFTLRYLLGYPRVRIYVGSWTEWAENERCRSRPGHRP